MATTQRSKKMLGALFVFCCCIHKGFPACTAPQDTLCSSCLEKKCTGDGCTCVGDDNGSGSEPCVLDDNCLLPESSCCPKDLKFNNVTKCCNVPVTNNSPKTFLTNKGNMVAYYEAVGDGFVLAHGRLVDGILSPNNHFFPCRP